MRTVHHIILLLMTFLFAGVVNARPQPHNELWTRLFVSHEFSKKIKAEGEYQFRLQETPSSDGIPTHRLQQGVRVWGYYKLNAAWTVGLSPFCFFRAYPLINTQTDFAAKNTTELRFAANSEWKKQISLFELKLRGGYESRHFKKDGNTEWTRKDRMRFRGMLTFPLVNIDSSFSAISLYAGDEYFFQGQDLFLNSIQFDQNRIITGISYKVCSCLKLDAMYMHILKYNSSGNYFERVVWINATIYL